MLNRRAVLTGVLATGALGATATASMAFRLHRTPGRHPFLTDEHLSALRNLAPTPTRVLFVGNSFTVGHDIPAQVAAFAAKDAVPVQVAMAAANGARLIETWRIPAVRDILREKWDALVFQDFSSTVLRATDRWASGFAMRQMARLAGNPAVLLYPTWALKEGHRIYGNDSFRTTPPANRADLAMQITAFYEGLAQDEGWTRAPVTETLHTDIDILTGRDGHHLNAKGAAKVSLVLWESLRDLL